MAVIINSKGMYYIAMGDSGIIDKTDLRLSAQ